MGQKMATASYRFRATPILFLLATGFVVVGCDETTNGGLFGQISSESISGNSSEPVSRTEEIVVERPDIFATTELGLWDGRPSFGGNWVAHPDADLVEQVRVTNQANGKQIVAALFRRERELPGPLIQVSSDAAEILELLAGQPTELDVVVIRREEVVIEEEPAVAAIETETDTNAETPVEISEASGAQEPEIDVDPIASAAAAIAAADGVEEVVEEAPKPSLFPLSKPFIQAGIFSIEENAIEASETLTKAGLEPVLSQDIINDKTFWRVIVGPAINRGQRNEMLQTVKSSGFTDAYFVKE